LENDLSQTEKDIISFDNHFRRGDINEYTIRSTKTRIVYKEKSILPNKRKEKNQIPGEIYITNDDYLNYKGELHIILKEMSYDKRKNLVGNIKKEEMILLKLIGPEKKFKFE